MRRATTRICYWMTQLRSKRRLREKDYELRMTRQTNSPELERARWEAFAIRREIASQARK